MWTMWRAGVRTVRFTPVFSMSFFTKSNENDRDVLNRPGIGTPKTGWERVKKMYSRDDYKEVSEELHHVVQASLCGAFFGACLGGFVQSKNAYIYFIENNEASIFKSMFDAKKKLQDYVTVAFAKGAYRWGWRLGFFTGLFSLITTTISVYRDDTSLLDFIAAGTITGALYKVQLGLAATFVGAGLGAVLSTIGGAAIVGLLKVTGVSMREIRQELYKIKEAREDQYNQALEKSAKIKHDELSKHHDALVIEKGELKIDKLQESV